MRWRKGVNVDCERQELSTSNGKCISRQANPEYCSLRKVRVRRASGSECSVAPSLLFAELVAPSTFGVDVASTSAVPTLSCKQGLVSSSQRCTLLDALYTYLPLNTFSHSTPTTNCNVYFLASQKNISRHIRGVDFAAGQAGLLHSFHPDSLMSSTSHPQPLFVSRI